MDASPIAERKALAEQNRQLKKMYAGMSMQNDQLQSHGSWRMAGPGIFETPEEAQEQATQWLWTYNNDRPNMGIDGITPTMKLKMAA